MSFCCCLLSDQGNLQGPKGLKAKRSREYFEVKHLGVEKKKRGRKRKSELLLRDPSSMKRPIVESKQVLAVGVAPMIPVGVQKPVLPLAAQPNGTVLPRPVLTSGSAVQLAPPTYQAISPLPPSPHGQLTSVTAVAAAPHNPLPSLTSTIQATAPVATQVKIGLVSPTWSGCGYRDQFRFLGTGLPSPGLGLGFGFGLGLAVREGWVDTSPESWIDPVIGGPLHKGILVPITRVKPWKVWMGKTTFFYFGAAYRLTDPKLG